MHVGKTVWHHEDWRSVPSLLPGFALRGGYLVLGGVFGSTAWSEVARIIPKLDFSEKGLCVGSFVRPRVALFVSVVFGNDGVPSRRQHKEIGDHCRLFGFKMIRWRQCLLLVDRLTALRSFVALGLCL